MPSRFPKVAPTKVIRRDEWQPDETVTIKLYLGGYDQERISSAGQSLERAADGRMEMRPRLHDRRQLELEVGIVAWTFYWLKDESDPASERQAMELTPEIIQSLPPKDREWIAARLDDAWAAWGVKPVTPTPPEDATQAVIEQATTAQATEVRAADAAFPEGPSSGVGGAATR